jgi:ribose transport system permease protein
MTQSDVMVAADRSAIPEAVRAARAAPAARFVRGLGVDRIGAVYVWLIICVVFAVWVPNEFANVATAKQVLNANAITALAALAVIVPLATRTFDLSFAFTMTLSGVTAAHFVAAGTPLVMAVLLGILVGMAIGLVNAFVVVTMRIDSFIGTLATGSLIQSFITMATGDTPIQSIKLSGGFSKIGQTDISGITLPVLYAIVFAFAIWYLLEHTATGRRLYATGFNPEASRLAGVRVERLRFASLIVSGLLAGVAGVVLASTLQSGSPSAGAPFLLPAFAAAFLGATQLKRGRFNAWGTIIAVLLLGTGTTGLGLASAPQWAANMFVGVVLIAALAVTGIQRRASRSAGAKRTWGRLRPGTST